VRAATFGPLITSVDIDVALIGELHLWLPTYLSRFEQERDLTPRLLPRPRSESFSNVLDDDEFPDHKLPAILVTSAETLGDPAMDGDGYVYTNWRATVSCVVRGRTPRETKAVASYYEACIRRLLVQSPHRSPALDTTGIADLLGEIKWDSTSVAAVEDPTNAGRYLAAGIAEFSVYVDHAVQAGVGPYEPADPYDPPEPEDPDDPDIPYDPLAAVGAVFVDVEGLPIIREPEEN
jgi:hypothetical protein